MAGPFETLVSNLNQMGFFGFLLPWLLMFAITYAVLLKSKALGDDKKVIGITALVSAFFVIGFGGPALGNFFIKLFGWGSILLGGILIILLFVSMAGGDFSKMMESKAAVALVAGIGIIIFIMALGSMGININPSDPAVTTAFLVLIMGAAVLFITSAK